MKTVLKISFTIITFMLLFTACKKDGDDTPQAEQVAKEITMEELLDYVIIEEYVPKSSAPTEYGDKPILTVAGIIKYVTENYYYAQVMDASFRSGATLKTVYDTNTGITTVNTGLAFIDLTRDASGQIVFVKSRPDDKNDFFKIRYFDWQYTQLVKRSQAFYNNTSYKNVTGNGYYRFRAYEHKWRYKADAVPSEAEMTWTFTSVNNNVWYGADGGSAQYNNLFIALPKGNGWKGQHKDKDLLIVNTMVPFHHRATGDMGVYEVNN